MANNIVYKQVHKSVSIFVFTEGERGGNMLQVVCGLFVCTFPVRSQRNENYFSCQKILEQIVLQRQ